MKFLPPGRGLWCMGSPVTEQRKLYAALNNCAFVSTREIKTERARPFRFLMDAAMLGVGVGFDTEGAGQIAVAGVKPVPPVPFVIDDTREGWCDSLEALMMAYFLGRPPPVFDYSKIRPAGTIIKTFGGLSSGPAALEQLHRNVRAVMDPLTGQVLTARAIVDIMNLIGQCVVAGNVRRTAEIAFGPHDSREFLDLKNYEVNPERAAFGWTSNNSIFAQLGQDYGEVVTRVQKNGEPGFAWLDNMRAFSRMHGDPDHKDARASGGNPCLEQTLESYELCCLVETFPNNHESFEDYQKTLKSAYLYAKTVTLGRTHWPQTNRVMLRNRRIGCSMSGLAQFITRKGHDELRRWCIDGYSAIQKYDQRFSDWLAIPRSIKTTSIKPSGTVSLLAGATPGMHYPESRFYIRRVTLSARSDLVPRMLEAGYPVRPSATGERASERLRGRPPGLCDRF
jgi:ribonucleoside-triphosphate reductase